MKKHLFLLVIAIIITVNSNAQKSVLDSKSNFHTAAMKDSILGLLSKENWLILELSKASSLPEKLRIKDKLIDLYDGKKTSVYNDLGNQDPKYISINTYFDYLIKNYPEGIYFGFANLNILNSPYFIDKFFSMGESLEERAHYYIIVDKMVSGKFYNDNSKVVENTRRNRLLIIINKQNFKINAVKQIENEFLSCITGDCKTGFGILYSNLSTFVGEFSEGKFKEGMLYEYKYPESIDFTSVVENVNIININKYYKGAFKDDEKFGMGLEYADNMIYQGEYKNNNKSGGGAVYDINANLVSQGIWENGTKHLNIIDGTIMKNCDYLNKGNPLIKQKIVLKMGSQFYNNITDMNGYYKFIVPKTDLNGSILVDSKKFLYVDKGLNSNMRTDICVYRNSWYLPLIPAYGPFGYVSENEQTSTFSKTIYFLNFFSDFFGIALLISDPLSKTGLIIFGTGTLLKIAAMIVDANKNHKRKSEFFR